MQTVPLQPIPNQTLQVQLGGQPCTLNVYQLQYGLFMDVYVGAAAIITGVICENMVLIVRAAYLGFVGDFAFVDTTGGGTNPVYTGFGTGGQYQLLYLTAADLAAEAA